MSLPVLALLALSIHPMTTDTAAITPPDSLICEGIPPVPAALAERMRRYTEVRSAALMDWAPDARAMLISTRFADSAQLHLVTSPGGARTQLTFFTDHVADASYPQAAAGFFVFSKDTGGGEFYQLYRYDTATGESTLLTDGKSRNLQGPWSNHGHTMAYGSTRRNGTDVDLYTIDPDKPGSDRLLAELNGGGFHPMDWSPDDSSILLQEYVSINESALWLMDARTGAKRLLTPLSGEKVYYGAVRFSKDGKGIYLTTDRDSEFKRLAYLDLATGDTRVLTNSIPWDVDDFDLTRDGRRLALVTNEDGVSVLRLMNTATGRMRRIDTGPPSIITGLRWRTGDELGFSMQSAHGGDAYSLNANSGKLTRWTFSETGGLNAALFPDPELVRWKSFDGRTISGFLYRPPARFTGKRPVIVVMHGGPESQYRPQFQGQNNYYLNEMGVAVLFPNVRGSAGYGKTFLTLDNGVLREGSYRDMGAALDWAAAQPYLDPARIMVMGGSYGGHMTLIAATRFSDRIRCARDTVGMSHLATFLEHTESYRRDLRRAEYGDERDPVVREFMDRTAPLNNVGKIQKALFVVQGANDPRVPKSEADQIVASLHASRVPVWYMVAKDEGHGFVKKRNTDFLLYATVLFLQQYLLN